MAGKLATRSHVPPMRWRVVTVADGSSQSCHRVEHCLMSGFLSTCRSVRDDPDGGFIGQR